MNMSWPGSGSRASATGEESPDFIGRSAQRAIKQAGAERFDGKCNRNKPPFGDVTCSL